MVYGSESECAVILIVLIIVVPANYMTIVCMCLIVYYASTGGHEASQIISALCIFLFVLLTVLVCLLSFVWIFVCQRNSRREQGILLLIIRN